MNALSFTRRFSRFLMIACLLAVAVPAGVAMVSDTAQAASTRGGGGGGGGGPDGGGGANRVLSCLGGTCEYVVPCTNGDCGTPSTECEGPNCGEPPCIGPNCGQPPCVGPSCDDNPPQITYIETPAGCQKQICRVEGNKMLCHNRVADEKLCAKKKS